MPQKSIEIILARQFIASLAMPAFITDAEGKIIYCNEPAETLLEFKFSETGEISAKKWQVLFTPQENGLSTEDLLSSSFAHHSFYYLHQKKYHIELFTIPVLNYADTFLGCIAFFQEAKT